jgi:hypothetical protein
MSMTCVPLLHIGHWCHRGVHRLPTSLSIRARTYGLDRISRGTLQEEFASVGKLLVDRGQNRTADRSRRRLGTQCERNYVISGIAPFCCAVQRANEAVKKAGAVAIRDFLRHTPDAGYWGCRLAEARPNVGDIVGSARPAGVDYDHQKAAITRVIAASHHKVPIWMHPRAMHGPTIAAKAKSKYEIWQVLGWPYEMSAAMARVVLSGMLDGLPEMKIITHHLGSMIPYFESRVGPLWDQLGTRIRTRITVASSLR